MALLDFFCRVKSRQQILPRERLQIIVAERRRGDTEPAYLPDMKKRFIRCVICKYVQIDPRYAICSV